MAELPAYLTMSDAEFDALIRQLDAALWRGAAFISLTSRGWRDLQVTDAAAAGFDEDSWVTMGPVVAELSPLFFFAFEDASDSVIQDWFREADDEAPLDEESVRRAVDRVAVIRSEMPTARLIWRERGESLLPTLQRLRYRIGPALDDGRTRTAIVEISTVIERPPHVRDQNRALTLEMLPSDIAYLRRVLNQIEHELTDGQ